MRLGDICNSIFSGKNIERTENGEYPVYGSTGEIARTNRYIYDKEQILIARVGANAGFVYKASGKYDVSDNTIIVDVKKDNCLQFVYHFLNKMKLNKLSKGGGQPLITSTQIKDLIICLPSIRDQQKIVEILDNFDKLVNDLSNGLPGEIEARQKQYEFYRDKLLNFKRQN